MPNPYNHDLFIQESISDDVTTRSKFDREFTKSRFRFPRPANFRKLLQPFSRCHEGVDSAVGGCRAMLFDERMQAPQVLQRLRQPPQWAHYVTSELATGR